MRIDLSTLEDKTFISLVIAISLAFAWILWPFYGAVLWGTVLAIVFRVSIVWMRPLISTSVVSGWMVAGWPPAAGGCPHHGCADVSARRALVPSVCEGRPRRCSSRSSASSS